MTATTKTTSIITTNTAINSCENCQAYAPGQLCQCDNLCQDRKDCCADYTVHCAPSTTTPDPRIEVVDGYFVLFRSNTVTSTGFSNLVLSTFNADSSRLQDSFVDNARQCGILCNTVPLCEAYVVVSVSTVEEKLICQTQRSAGNTLGKPFLGWSASYVKDGAKVDFVTITSTTTISTTSTSTVYTTTPQCATHRDCSNVQYCTTMFTCRPCIECSPEQPAFKRGCPPKCLQMTSTTTTMSATVQATTSMTIRNSTVTETPDIVTYTLAFTSMVTQQRRRFSTAFDSKHQLSITVDATGAQCDDVCTRQPLCTGKGYCSRMCLRMWMKCIHLERCRSVLRPVSSACCLLPGHYRRCCRCVPVPPAGGAGLHVHCAEQHRHGSRGCRERDAVVQLLGRFREEVCKGDLAADQTA